MLISVRIPDETGKVLDDAAARLGVTRSEAVRRLIVDSAGETTLGRALRLVTESAQRQEQTLNTVETQVRQLTDYFRTGPTEPEQEPA